MKKLAIALLLVWSSLSPALILAESRYVTDDLSVPLRRGKDLTFKILKMLRTGTTVELLGEPDGEWIKVRAEGIEGWVPTQYLMETPPARTRIDTMTKGWTALESERNTLKEKLTTMEPKFTALQQVEAELNHIKSISAKAMQLDQENKKLKEQLAVLETTLQQETTEKDRLQNESDTRFFLAGAGVLTMGMLGGFLLSRRRRGRFDELS